MPLKYREDPYGGYNFEILINGISDDGTAVKGSFSEASGLEVDIQPIEYRNGSEDITMRKIPGLKKNPNIVLKRGIIGEPEAASAQSGAALVERAVEESARIFRRLLGNQRL